MTLSDEALIAFVRRAKQATYARVEQARRVRETDGSTSLRYEEGPWSYHDGYFGGEPYGGREVVLFEGRPVWMMVYYGVVPDLTVEAGEVYAFLRQALDRAPEGCPVRGPAQYAVGEFTYGATVRGDFRRFDGEEVIREAGREVYRAWFAGGLVDRRSGR